MNKLPGILAANDQTEMSARAYLSDFTSNELFDMATKWHSQARAQPGNDVPLYGPERWVLFLSASTFLIQEITRRLNAAEPPPATGWGESAAD